MGRRRVCFSAAVAILAMAVGGGAGRAAEPARPEVEIVVRTNLRQSPAHTDAFLAAMCAEAEKCLGGLFDRRAPKAQPASKDAAASKEPAARYRLTIENAATINLSNSWMHEPSRYDTAYIVRFIQSQMKGAYQFTLSKCSDPGNPVIDRWTFPIAREYHYHIGDSVTSATMAPERQRALMKMMPDTLQEALVSRLLPIRMLQNTSMPGQTRAFTLQVQNRSLWPLKKLQVTITWNDEKCVQMYRYRGTVDYEGLLMPGKQTALSGVAPPIAVTFDFEFKPAMALSVKADFETSRGPEWVRGQLEIARDPARRRDAVAAIRNMADQLEPEEAKAAGPGLLGLCSNDSPKSALEVPADAVELIAKLGAHVLPAIAEGMKSPNAGVRLAAATALVDIKTTDRAVLGRLWELMKDKNEAVREAAANALKAHGQAVPPPKPVPAEPGKTAVAS